METLPIFRRRADAERIVAEREWKAGLKPTKPQEPCDHGLFGDEARQLDLPMARKPARLLPVGRQMPKSRRYIQAERSAGVNARRSPSSSLTHSSDRYYQRDKCDDDQVFRQQDRHERAQSLAVILNAKSLPPICTLRSLWRAAPIVALPEKSIFNFRVDAMEPLLCALALLPVRRHFGLKLGNPILGRSKLVRQLLSHIESMLTICFGHAGGLMKQSKNCLPCFVDLIDTIRSRAPRSRCKRNDKLQIVATRLTTHFTLPFVFLQGDDQLMGQLYGHDGRFNRVCLDGGALV